MANVGYIQFFLTDRRRRDAAARGRRARRPRSIVCTENILSGEGMISAEAFAGGKAVCTSILVHEAAGGWKFWSRHASPIAELPMEED